MIEQAFPLLFAVLFGAVIVGIILGARIQKILRVRYPKIYGAMGSPTLIRNNTIQNNIAFTKFLLRREYRSIDDKDLFKICNITFWFMSAYIMYFAFIVLLLAYLIKA